MILTISTEIALQLTSSVKVCKISAEWTKLANILRLHMAGRGIREGKMEIENRKSGTYVALGMSRRINRACMRGKGGGTARMRER